MFGRWHLTVLRCEGKTVLRAIDIVADRTLLHLHFVILLGEATCLQIR